jgi:hypothetical protein
MQKHPTKSRTYICDDPENVIVSFSPPDPNRRITFGFKSSNVTALPVINDQIHFQMGSSMTTLFVQFFFPAGGDTACQIQIQGSSGGSFPDNPSIKPQTGDGKIRIYTFE